jgi:predicted ThiF/HesA family dinucleotide-utilizing enzyme
MEQMKREYGETLPGKLGDLRRLVHLACAAPGDTPEDAQVRKAARTAAHKLAGTAGSYGFPEESITAAVVEAQAVQAERAAPEARPACWAIAESALEDELLASVCPTD